MNRLRHVAESGYATSEHEAQLIDLIIGFRDSRQEINAYFNSLHQERGESIKQYHERVTHFFVFIGDVDRQPGTTLSELDEEYHLQEMIETFLVGLKNKQLSRQLLSIYQEEGPHIFSLAGLCVAASVKYASMKHERRLQKEEDRRLLQQQLQEFVDRGSAQTLQFYESQAVSKDLSCNLLEINTVIEDKCDTESIDEVLASGPGKWIVADAGKEVFDSTSTPAGSLKNQPAPHVKKDIDAVAVDNCDTEATDEVLASGPGKWIAAAAGKEVFDCAVTLDEVSKNPPASSTEDMEISVAMDMPSLKHLMDMDGPAIEAFDSGIAMDASSKNPSIQQTEYLETTEKTSDSAYIYELPALPAFDHSIAIDFEAYTTNSVTSGVTCSSMRPSVTPFRRKKMQLSPFRGLALRNTSFGWSRSSTIPIDSRISSASTCTSVSAVTSVSDVTPVDTVDTEFCEGEQLFCSTVYPSVSDSIECTTMSDTDFYGGEQSSCFLVDAICTVVVVANTDALTLTAGMIKKEESALLSSFLVSMLLLAWTSVLSPVVDVAPKPKHKGLPKVKIKY